MKNKLLSAIIAAALLLSSATPVFAQGNAILNESAVVSSEVAADFNDTVNKLIKEADEYIYQNDIILKSPDFASDVETYKSYKYVLKYIMSAGSYTENTLSYASNAANALYYQYFVIQMDVDRSDFLEDEDNISLLDNVAASTLDFDYSSLSFEELFEAVKKKNSDTALYYFEYVPKQYHEGMVGKFYDVSTSDWYYQAVKYACNNELFLGTAENIFSPEDTMTRGMFITVLGRLASASYSGDNSSFTDIDPEEYYAPFVAWAKENGVLDWVESNYFYPDSHITREEMFACMFALAKTAEGNTASTDANAASAFSDYNSVSEFAKDATAWAVNTGVVNGNGNNTLSPLETATRAEVAQIMKNFSSKISIVNKDSIIQRLDQ